MLLDFIYIFYYISRNLIFSIFFRNEIFLKLLNGLIRPNDELISAKIKKQTGLFLKNLELDQFDRVLHFGSGFVSYKPFFDDKIYLDYDKYIYGISNKKRIIYNPENSRTLLISISVFQHIENFELTMDELLSGNVAEIRTVIDCSLQYFPKVKNRFLVNKLKRTVLFEFITRHIYISDRKITDYLFYFESKGFDLFLLNYIDKEYMLSESDRFNTYFVIWRKKSKNI